MTRFPFLLSTEALQSRTILILLAPKHRADALASAEVPQNGTTSASTSATSATAPPRLQLRIHGHQARETRLLPASTNCSRCLEGGWGTVLTFTSLHPSPLNSAHNEAIPHPLPDSPWGRTCPTAARELPKNCHDQHVLEFHPFRAWVNCVR